MRKNIKMMSEYSCLKWELAKNSRYIDNLSLDWVEKNKV